MDTVPKQDGANLDPPMLALCWTLAAVAIIVVSLRLLIRVRLTHGLRIDDYFMVLALVRFQFTSNLETALTVSQDLWSDMYSSRQRCSFLGPWKTFNIS